MSDTQAEYKVKSFRVDDETFEKFKLISTDVFSNQGQCLSALINLYETENSKATLIERKLEIESFQTHINKVSEIFLMSLQLNQDAEIRIRAEFEKLLESKDRTILDLQNKTSDLTISLSSLEVSSKDIKEENTFLSVKALELDKNIKKQNNDFASALSDKDNLNIALTDTCNVRKVEIEKLKQDLVNTEENCELLKNIEVENRESLKNIEEENNKLISNVDRLTVEIIKQKDFSELDKEKALLSADKIHQQEIREFHLQQHEEIREYMTKIDRFQEQLESSRNEIMRLTKIVDSKPAMNKVAKNKKGEQLV